MAKRLLKVSVLDKPLACHHCGHDRFSAVSFAYFGTWFARQSFDCARCGHEHVFLKNAAIKTTQA